MELRPGYKKTEIGVIPEDWEVVRLRDCFSISAGGDIDRSRSSAVQDSRFPFPVYLNAITNRGLYGFADYAVSPANSGRCYACAAAALLPYLQPPAT